MTARKGGKPTESEATLASKAIEVQETAGKDSANFPIVGIGASAGGLAAFEAFFSAMPADTEPGMAFVLVQHLATDGVVDLRLEVVLGDHQVGGAAADVDAGDADLLGRRVTRCSRLGFAPRRLSSAWRLSRT